MSTPPTNAGAVVMANALRKDLERRTASLKSLFQSEITASARNIQEEDFKRLFLPWFAGEQKDTDGQLMQVWLNVAGSPYASVDLVNEMGTVVGVVPPIQDRNVIPIKSDRGDTSLDYLFMRANNTASLSPKAAVNELAVGLKKRFGNTYDQQSLAGARQKWVELLQHYGKGPAGAGAFSGEGPNNKPDGEIELVYD